MVRLTVKPGDKPECPKNLSFAKGATNGEIRRLCACVNRVVDKSTVESLDLSSTLANDETLEILINSIPNLKVLNISDCPAISDVGVQCILDYMQHRWIRVVAVGETHGLSLWLEKTISEVAERSPSAMPLPLLQELVKEHCSTGIGYEDLIQRRNRLQEDACSPEDDSTRGACDSEVPENAVSDTDPEMASENAVSETDREMASENAASDTDPEMVLKHD